MKYIKITDDIKVLFSFYSSCYYYCSWDEFIIVVLLIVYNKNNPQLPLSIINCVAASVSLSSKYLSVITNSKALRVYRLNDHKQIAYLKLELQILDLHSSNKYISGKLQNKAFIAFQIIEEK